MLYAVMFYSQTMEDGPANWPHTCFEINDDKAQNYVDNNFTILTELELEQHKANNRADYDLWHAIKYPLPTALQLLESKSLEYIIFGTQLYTKIKQKVWAINTLGKSQGKNLSLAQMQNILLVSDQIEKSLRSGSLDTAKYICTQLKTAFPSYTSVANFAIYEIDEFMRAL